MGGVEQAHVPLGALGAGGAGVTGLEPVAVDPADAALAGDAACAVAPGRGEAAGGGGVVLGAGAAGAGVAAPAALSLAPGPVLVAGLVGAEGPRARLKARISAISNPGTPIAKIANRSGRRVAASTRRDHHPVEAVLARASGPVRTDAGAGPAAPASGRVSSDSPAIDSGVTSM